MSDGTRFGVEDICGGDGLTVVRVTATTGPYSGSQAAGENLAEALTDFYQRQADLTWPG